MRKQYKNEEKNDFFCQPQNIIEFSWWEILFLCPIFNENEWLRRMMWKFSRSNWLWMCISLNPECYAAVMFSTFQVTTFLYLLKPFVSFPFLMLNCKIFFQRKVFFVIVIMEKATKKRPHFQLFLQFLSAFFFINFSRQRREFHQKMYVGQCSIFTNFLLLFLNIQLMYLSFN